MLFCFKIQGKATRITVTTGENFRTNCSTKQQINNMLPLNIARQYDTDSVDDAHHSYGLTNVRLYEFNALMFIGERTKEIIN